MLKANNKKLKRDVFLILVSIALAIVVWQLKIIDNFIGTLHQGRLLSAFIAGFFFTSAFTTAPALAFLLKIAQFNSIILVALLGAAGALLGDAIIFHFVRDRLWQDFTQTLKKTRRARIRHFFKSKIIRYSMAAIGGILIALPLFPDETALAIMGITKIKTRVFIILTFTFNFLSIFLLSLAAKHWL